MDAEQAERAPEEPAPGARKEPSTPPAQVGGSGRRLPASPGADSGRECSARAANRRGGGAGAGAWSLAGSSGPGGARDPGERGEGAGARPLARPHAQQQLLRVQPQLHGRVREPRAALPVRSPTPRRGAPTSSPLGPPRSGGQTRALPRPDESPASGLTRPAPPAAERQPVEPVRGGGGGRGAGVRLPELRAALRSRGRRAARARDPMPGPGRRPAPPLRPVSVGCRAVRGPAGRGWRH